MPRRRVFGDLARQQLLDAARAFRSACVAALTAAPIGGADYVAANRALEATDDLAEALTGNRRLFHNQPHSAGP
jgi:hypothetical protein